MWSCSYCGNHTGMPYEDSQLKGMLCLHPDCGRFNPYDDDSVELDGSDM
jgi:hypothetical protein